MTTQAITANETNTLTNFDKLWSWMKAIDDGFDYDPQDQLIHSHKRLTQQVEGLQARLDELERHQNKKS